MAATSVAFSWLSSIPSFNSTSSHKIAFKIWALPTTNCLIKGLHTQNPISSSTTRCCSQNPTRLSHLTPLYATLRSPKGFGPPQKSKKNKKKTNKDDDNDEDEEEEEPDEGVIPEIVTNRMISRMGLTVGAPLFVGLLFFPFFYYLKVGLKIDVPTWVPFIVSFFFFGSALLGVSYGIVSSSWDPMREGSFWGWNEAQKNWPVFWQSFWGGSKRK